MRRVVAVALLATTSQTAQRHVSQDELAKLANDPGSTLLDDATASERLVRAALDPKSPEHWWPAVSAAARTLGERAVDVQLWLDELPTAAADGICG